MPEYYILGSRRRPDDVHWVDRTSDMVKEGCLAVGHGWSRRSFERLYGKPESDIVSELKKVGESPASYHAHKLFLNLRPGDWVAVKKYCAPNGHVPVLVINAYARVVQREGVVYYRGRAPLYHCVHANFLKHGNEYTFHLGYGRTIHRLTNPEHIRQIFAPVFGKKPPKSEVAAPATRAHWRRKAALLTIVEDQTRRIRAHEVETRQDHDRIRNRLYRHLVRQHGEGNVFMEQDFVDLRVSEPKTLVLYEIKPYRNVLQCVREALGQVLLYAWREATISHQKLKLIVVGPAIPTKEENEFMDFVKRTVKIELCYLPFR